MFKKFILLRFQLGGFYEKLDNARYENYHLLLA